MAIFKSECSSLGKKEKKKSVIFSRGWREGEKRTFPPTALIASLKALRSQYLQAEWLQQPKRYKTKMQIGYKKAPCWQHIKLGNTFTLPIIMRLGSKWGGRAFSLDTPNKDKLHLLNQKQVITVISFLITSLNSSKSAVLRAHFIRLWMNRFETPTLSSL